MTRRHTGRNPRWWVAAENPAEELPFSRRPRPFRYESTAERTPPEAGPERADRRGETRRRRLAVDAVSVDIEERTDRFILTADLPGLTTRDIDVMVRGPRVRLVAEYPTEPDVQGETTLRRERPRGTVERTFGLPGRIDEARVTATYLDGTLRVELPKRRGRRSVDVE